jgi:tetratricopeptide (TPR) repeat protein
MSTASLRTALSRWENGRVRPDPMHRQLLREIFGLTDDELGFGTDRVDQQAVRSADDELRQRMATSDQVDAGLVQLLQQQTDNVRKLDRRLGAPILLEQMRAHVETLHTLLGHAILDSVRRPVAAALADAAALAGWQALDVGALSQAWGHYEMAKDAARTAGDRALLAHAKGEQAYALLDLNRPQDALELVREARQEAGQAVPPRLLSWLWAAEAETAAAAGRGGDCRRALDAADQALPLGHDGAELPYLSLDACHLARWRGSALARLGDREAVDHLEGALAGMDADYIRARGGLHLDLAQALTAVDAPDEAQRHIRVATDLAGQTGSVRQRRRLAQLAA